MPSFADTAGLTTVQMSAEAPWSARAPAAGIDGKLMENALPSFWSDALSRAFADTRPGTASGSSDKPDPGAGVIRRAELVTPADVRLRAKQLRAAGYSYGEIAKMLGVSKTQAYRLANED